jgi:hypothetical protein
MSLSLSKDIATDYPYGKGDIDVFGKVLLYFDPVFLMRKFDNVLLHLKI